MASVARSKKKKSVDENFKLDEAFLDKYRHQKPKFGYNGLGEFVFYRTYSRTKPDGSKESFFDTVKRVVEGCYEIQRRHCVNQHTPWSYKKAQKSAQEMFDRMWNFKFLPPGRGLWAMGTDFMWSKGSGALNNCFRGDTEIITRQGIKQLRDVVGTTQTLLTKGGKWVDARIHSFGEQELLKVTVRRGRHRKVIYATRDHRWLVKSKAPNLVAAGPSTARAGGYKTRSCNTADLKPGMRLSAVFSSGINNGMLRPSVPGIMHGFCFGDGTTGSSSDSHGTYLYLCKPKDEEMLQYFAACHHTDAPERGSAGAVRVADLPRFYRRKPDLNEAATYLFGWLAGYFAADGKVSKRGTCRISSAKREDLETVRSVCAILGIGCHPITQEIQTVRHNGQVKKFIGYGITLFADHLNEKFFLLSKHRERFVQHRNAGARRKGVPAHMHWYVDSIEETGIIEDVYCPQVPDYACFALADNILTGNCGYISTEDIADDPAEPFSFMIDMSMLGVGIGFDTKGAGKLQIHKPVGDSFTHIVDDSREGWAHSVAALIESYAKPPSGRIEFDYSHIRPAGSPINGFGGVASGPDILRDLHQMMIKKLDEVADRENPYLTSADITDLMNFIGKCVVAGNVRRCLPAGTLVHLKRGLVPIEDVQVGDQVLTSNGYCTVAENVHQGEQDVITINTKMGPFRCTAKHRIAVMDSFGSYVWKRAYQLEAGDRMVFVNEVVPGTETVLPGYSNLSVRGNKLTVPGLTSDIAWFIGMLHGDGHVYVGRKYKNRETHGAYVSVSVNRDEYHDDLVNKIKLGYEAFGFKNIRCQSGNDNCHKLRVASRHLAKYLYENIKQPKKPLNVPECVRMGLPEIRAGYLAGLLDSSGSDKNRPTTLILSVYRDFVRQVQAVYSSLGIPTRMQLRQPAAGNCQAKWELSLVGDFAINKFRELIGPHAVKQLRSFENHSSNDFGCPAEWVTESDAKHGRNWSPQQDQMAQNCAVLCQTKVSNLVPIEVYSVVDEGVKCDTYDLSVPDRNEFVAQGLLVHNTAQIAFGEPDDEVYRNLKNPMHGLDGKERAVINAITNKIFASGRDWATKDDINLADPESLDGVDINKIQSALETWNALVSHRWASNNSIYADVGMDYSEIADSIATNGEPGLLWLDNIQNFGRMKDGRRPGIDRRAKGSNPCVEQSLESHELCCLVESFPANHDSVEDYHRTLKYAYLYAKSVTLLPTHCELTNQVLLRNRRIGLSQTGIVQAFEKFGRRRVLQDFCDKGYDVVRKWDDIYSEWLAVPKSIKVTSIKPSGSVSLLAGATAGIHYTIAPSRSYWRRVRISSTHPLVNIAKEAGYKVETALTDKYTSVITFGIHEPNIKTVGEVSIWEQMKNAVDYQYYWADNQVSVTIQFKPDEANMIATLLSAFEDQLKGVSFLPLDDHGYPQAPYERATPEEVEAYNAQLRPLDFSSYLQDGEGSKFCDGDKCVI